MEVVRENSDQVSEGTSELFDLAVVGGGPAGTAAAVTAARAGAKVLLLERGRLPRQRVCGEFVSAESLDLLAGLLADSESDLLQGAIRVSEARLFIEGRTICMPVSPPAASIGRFDLDAALWRAAELSGVAARSQTTAESVKHAGNFEISTTGSRFQARALVSAVGRWSNLVVRYADDAETQWLGVKGHFAEESGPGSVDLYFFEGGYCGVQPVRLAGDSASVCRVNVCAMVRSDVARTLPEVFRLHPQLQMRTRAWQALMEPVATFPLMFHKPRPVKDETLFVGDAAGFVDPFVGDGISLALRSGAMAAECLASFFRGEISRAEAADRYRRKYDAELAPTFRSSSKIRRLLGLPSPVRRAGVQLLEKSPAVSRLLVKMTR
jgi:flavin-dependent dehydrogenase